MWELGLSQYCYHTSNNNCCHIERRKVKNPGSTATRGGHSVFLNSLLYLLCSLQAIRSELEFARLLPASIWHYKAGNPQSTSEAEAPYKHFVVWLFVLANILKDRSISVFLLWSACFAECGITTKLKACPPSVANTQPHTLQSHPVQTQDIK